MEQGIYKIVSKPGCVFCEKAKDKLTDLELEFTEKVLGRDISKAELLELVPDAVTVPQIFLDDAVIGGWEDLERHLARIRQ